ncbi:MAG: DUF4340 domain-containing protein [Bacteroidales bacterium]|nr:DUF4340 domain-containing protein [Bacteroidales bacterium]
MKNIKRVIPFILILFIPVIWFVFFYNSEEDPSEMFIIKNTSVVYQVNIKKGKQIVNIKKKNNGNKWVINNKYEANDKSVKRLIQALKEVKIYRPVKKEKLDSVINILKDKGTSVQIFNKNKDIIKEWIIAPYEESSKGTYIMNKTGREPFLVNIPGLENNLNYRYNTNSIYWMKTELFSYQPSEITEIELQYNNESSKSFRLEIENDKVKLFSLNPETQIQNIDYNKVGSYLSYFMNVKFTSFYNFSIKEKDSLLITTPEYTIILKDKYNNTKNIKLFLIKNKENPNKLNLNKMKAVVNDEDLVIVKFYDIDLILKDITYFIN